MSARVTGQVLALAIGLAPVLLLLVTWTPHGPEPWMRVVRYYVAPILLIEALVILGAIADGLVTTIKRIRLPRSAVIAAALLAAIMIGTVLVAPAPQAALLRNSFWILHVGFALSVLHFAQRRFEVPDLVRAYALGFVLFAVVLTVLLAQVRDPGFDWTYDLPAFSHVRHFGYYALAAAGLATGLMAVSRTWPEWAAAFGLAAIAFGLALWTGSRGAIGGAAGGLLGGLLFVPAVRRPRAWAGLGASFAIALLAASQLQPPAPTLGAGRLVTATVQTADASTGRTKLWLHVARAVAERPIFGHGDGQMRFVAPFADLGQPHSVILQILLAWGAVGLLCIAVLAVQFLRAAIPVVRAAADDLAAPFVVMAAIATLAIIDGTLYHAFPTSIFAACAGMIGSRMQLQPAEA